MHGPAGLRVAPDLVGDAMRNVTCGSVRRDTAGGTAAGGGRKPAACSPDCLACVSASSLRNGCRQ